MSRNLVKSYFFVPADRPRFIEKSGKLSGIDARVFDLEDAVHSSRLQDALTNLAQTTLLPSDWVRIPVGSEITDVLDRLKDLGFKQFVIPKTRNRVDAIRALDLVTTCIPNARIILLVEHPRLFMELQAFLETDNGRIHGIGLGSHDLSAELGMRHEPTRIDPFRQDLLVMARAYEILPIDIASMEIGDRAAFTLDLDTAVGMGYRAKFLIHPDQLEILNAHPFHTRAEVDQANDILAQLKAAADRGESVQRVGGKLYEKPHIERLMEIRNWGETFYGTDR